MAETTAQATPARRVRPDWRSREIRPSNKVVARRVSEDDHQALKRFAEAHGTKIAEMIAPAVEELIEQARAFCRDIDVQDQEMTAKAS
jgi:hypothetical protein